MGINYIDELPGPDEIKNEFPLSSDYVHKKNNF